MLCDKGPDVKVRKVKGLNYGWPLDSKSKKGIRTFLRVPNRFGRMRDLTFFRRDIWDFELKTEEEAEITITSGSGI